ncbi:hypothetical protein LshimejAT787_0701510 [Lyophyllum shimeji]|uniref:Uncharacterized protein n=1 Tax=Lyophyllum shimeji TaxID=47721 RepID=A0A9P3UQW1_LYOSH|nr:hypothetical protein LshimejAT787_0701510 [Lyophyllum shimeji]
MQLRGGHRRSSVCSGAGRRCQVLGEVEAEAGRSLLSVLHGVNGRCEVGTGEGKCSYVEESLVEIDFSIVFTLPSGTSLHYVNHAKLRRGGSRYHFRVTHLISTWSNPYAAFNQRQLLCSATTMTAGAGLLTVSRFFVAKRKGTQFV